MEEKEAIKASKVSIISNIALSIFKLISGIVANSSAMISDAVHSLSDVVSTFIVIIITGLGIGITGIKNIISR